MVRLSELVVLQRETAVIQPTVMEEMVVGRLVRALCATMETRVCHQDPSIYRRSETNYGSEVMPY